MQVLPTFLQELKSKGTIFGSILLSLHDSLWSYKTSLPRKLIWRQNTWICFEPIWLGNWELYVKPKISRLLSNPGWTNLCKKYKIPNEEILGNRQLIHFLVYFCPFHPNFRKMPILDKKNIQYFWLSTFLYSFMSL